MKFWLVHQNCREWQRWRLILPDILNSQAIVEGTKLKPWDTPTRSLDWLRHEGSLRRAGLCDRSTLLWLTQAVVNGNIFWWKVGMILLPIASAAWWSVSKVRDVRYSIKAAAKTAVLMELDHKSFHLQNWFLGIIKESSKVFSWQPSSNGWTEISRAGTVMMAWRVRISAKHILWWVDRTDCRQKESSESYWADQSLYESFCPVHSLVPWCSGKGKPGALLHWARGNWPHEVPPHGQVKH